MPASSLTGNASTPWIVYVDDVKAELLLRPAANVAAENAAQ